MKSTYCLLGLIATLALSPSAVLSEVHYVALDSTDPAPPFSTWATAAHTIQAAADFAQPGSLIVVSNGVYKTGGVVVKGTTTNRVALTKALRVESLNGPAVTVIEGRDYWGTSPESRVRCAYVGSGASLAGFKLINGSTSDGDPFSSGGGAWCESPSATLSNCIVAENHPSGSGGGVYGGSLFRCTITNNFANQNGGGAEQSQLFHCIVAENMAGNTGGGTYNSQLQDCEVSGNNTYGNGAGVAYSDLRRCIVKSNSAGGGVRANGGGAWKSTLVDSVVLGNLLSIFSDGEGAGVAESTLTNCTVVANTTTYWTEIGFGGGACNSTLRNCIVVGNSAATGSNYHNCTIEYTCTTPLPEAGPGNFADAPTFVNMAAGDLRLTAGSPGINAGHSDHATRITDLQGYPRVMGGQVDVGAFEFLEGLSEFQEWLRSYKLPFHSQADHLDSDSDCMGNFAEWIAGTNPTNTASALRFSAPSRSPLGAVTLTWTSVTNRSYAIERTSGLGSPSGFSLVQDDISGLEEVTTFVDTNAPSGEACFYRIKVTRLP